MRPPALERLPRTSARHHRAACRRAPSLALGFALLLLLSAFPAGAQEAALRAKEVRQGASLVWSRTYELPCRVPVLERILRSPELLSALWGVYGFAPDYAVSGAGDRFHVRDPIGIDADCTLAESTASRRAYLAVGSLEHWAVPGLNTGRALFELDYEGSGAGTQLRVTVSVLPDSRAVAALVTSMATLVEAHIRNRISLNMEDAAVILGDLQKRPSKVAARLPAARRAELRRLFAK